MNDISILFFQIWRNVWLKSEIFRHLRIFNIVKRNPKHNLSLENYYIKCKLIDYKINKYREYITNLMLSDHKFEQQENNGQNELYISSVVEKLMLYNFNQPLEILNQMITPWKLPNLNTLILNKFDQPTLDFSLIPSQIKKLVILEFNGTIINNKKHNDNGSSELKILKFGKFNKNLNKNDIPSTVTYLNMGYYWDRELSEGIFPNSIIKLKLGPISRTIKKGVLPKQLKTLVTLSKSNDQFETDGLPESLTNIQVQNYLLDKFIIKGPNLKTLNYNNTFDVTPSLIDVEPYPSLTNFRLGHFYGYKKEKEIDGYLHSLLIYSNSSPTLIPSNFNDIQLCRYEQLEEKPSLQLPSGLKYLYLNYSIDRPILQGFLPTGILKLTLAHQFNHPLEFLPSSLTYLSLDNNLYDKPITVGSLPSSLTKLVGTFVSPIENGALPSSLKSLKILSPNYIHPIELPAGLKSLSFQCVFDCSKFNLSDLKGLTKLHILPHKNPSIIPCGSIPNSVTNLILPKLNEPKIRLGQIPNSVKKLTINYYTEIQENSIPNSVTRLTLLPLDAKSTLLLNVNQIPPSVLNLKLHNFNQPIQPNVLPYNLVSIKFDEDFDQELTVHNIPPSVLKLKISCSYNKSLLDKKLKRNLILIKK